MTDLPSDLTPQIRRGHVLDALRDLPDSCVHLAVTSPPYWGLRAYGTRGQVWGGDRAHAHEWVPTAPRRERTADDAGGEIQKAHEGASYRAIGGEACSCGAWLGELGLEPTPELYVEHMSEVFSEVRRVLRPDGTLWLNLGDTYATHPAGLTGPARWKKSTLGNLDHSGHEQAGAFDKRAPGLKPKDLVGIPWRVALRLQSDGWWLRADCVWAKPNPMPESVTDRPTRSHEYVFILSKSPRYYFDADAVRGPLAPSTAERVQSHLSNPADNPETDSKWGNDNWRSYPVIGRYFAPSTAREVLEGYDGEATKPYTGTGAQDPSAVKRRIVEGIRKKAGLVMLSPPSDKNRPRSGFDKAQPKGGESSLVASKALKDGGWNELPRAVNILGANLKTVWWVPTQPYPAAHFATFPERIPEIAISAGTSERGVCPNCGTPWRRHVKAEGGTIGHDYRPDKSLEARGTISNEASDGTYRRSDLGFRARCRHGDEKPIPALVLDPFAGSGTVLQVARRMGRSSLGIELKPEYVKLARKRSGADTPDITGFA